jgi:selenocysteine lyase/cysteine desulfurase
MGDLIVMPERKQPVESGWTWMEEEVRRAMRTTGLTFAALALAEECGAVAVDIVLGELLEEALERLQDINVGVIFEDNADKAETWDAQYALVGRLGKAILAIEALGPEAVMA